MKKDLGGIPHKIQNHRKPGHRTSIHNNTRRLQ